MNTLIVLAINQYQILLVNLLCGSLPVDISLRSFFLLPFEFNGFGLAAIGLWAGWSFHVEKIESVSSECIVNIYNIRT